MHPEPTTPHSSHRTLKTRGGDSYELPLFLPVYQPKSPILPIDDWGGERGVEGCIVNAYFLYKDRRLRQRFESGLDLHEYVGTDGLVMTDSGAFQGFTRRLLLKNKDIVLFQDRIGSNIVSPLDIVTPPGDSRRLAQRKLERTLQRVREAKYLVEHAILAGVQQGGRYPDLRLSSIEGLMDVGVKYIAVGSLVPFFTRNHDLRFVGDVLHQIREVAGPDIPVHVYGAGDPLELPFMVALGADIFDSASYAHFARGGWYMTPYGALREPTRLLDGEYPCDCRVCSRMGVEEVFEDERRLAAHNLWTIIRTISRVREAMVSGTLDAMIRDILDRHERWFAQTRLGSSWEALHDG